MRFILVALLCVFSFSARAADATLPKGCLVVARCFEAKAQKRLHDSGVWARLLHLTWLGGRDKGHAICIFSLSNGDVWTYDSLRGSISLRIRERDIESVAKALQRVYPPFRHAHYID